MKFVIVTFLILIGFTANASDRVALVIGNSKYESVSTLFNPGKDARGIADELRTKGFLVTERIDRSRSEMVRDLREFRTAADAAEIALVYFAGHGIEVAGENYLIPTDAVLTDQRDIQNGSVSLDSVLDSVSGATKLKMIVLDACRDNPFANQMIRAGNARSVGRGLGRVEAQASNTLIAYAAAAGEVTPDGPIGKHSPFTSAFLKGLRSTPRDVRLMMGVVRDELRKQLGPGVDPFIYASLGGDQIVLNKNSDLVEKATAVETPIEPLTQPREKPDSFNQITARRVKKLLVEATADLSSSISQSQCSTTSVKKVVEIDEIMRGDFLLKFDGVWSTPFQITTNTDSVTLRPVDSSKFRYGEISIDMPDFLMGSSGRTLANALSEFELSCGGYDFYVTVVE